MLLNAKLFDFYGRELLICFISFRIYHMLFNFTPAKVYVTLEFVYYVNMFYICTQKLIG